MVKNSSEAGADRRVLSALAASGESEASITQAADIHGSLMDALRSGELTMGQLAKVGGFLCLRPSELAKVAA